MECTYARTRALERAYAEVSGRAFSNCAPFRDKKLLWMKRPRYKPEHTRIVIDDGGNVVAGVAIVELPVRYGDAVLRLGGISCVATDPDHQKKGYGRACMQDAVNYMMRDGFDISLLLGIRNYYHRFGYRTALTWWSCSYHPREVQARMPKGFRDRKMRRGDIPQMDALYKKTIGRYDLSVARTEEDWRWYLRFGRMKHGYVLLDRDGALVAYLNAEPRGDQLRVSEIAVADSTEAHEGVLALLRKRAKEAFATTIEVFAPPEGPFARYCLYKKRIAWRRWTDYEGGPMLRLFNMEPLFAKVAGTLSARWQNAPRNTPAEAVTIRCSMGQVALIPTDGELVVRPGERAGQLVEMPDEALTELFMGFRPAEDVLADAGVTVTGAASRVLGAVFPVSTPFIPPTDHM